MAKYRNIFLLSIVLLLSVESRESYELSFGKGDNIQILADKGYMRLRQNLREVVGNVIITHGANAVYGEKASISRITGDVDVVGNVRYVAPGITLYGSYLHLNYKDGTMKIQNARILTESFVVLGKELSRISPNVFVGENAEYTTCQDCPESWSISGKRIHVTVDEYIRIWHGQVKINGTVVMYVPYIILPIKQDRETGFLFPEMKFVDDEGAWVRLPWYWAINDNSDMTLTPSLLGSRGWGNEFEYRNVWGEKKWFDISSFGGIDRIYESGKVSKTLSGSETFRHFSEYEHHFSGGNILNHHFYLSDGKDLDVARDYDFHLKNRVQGSELMRGGFLDFRTSLFNLSAETYFNRNLLVENPRAFDHSYVQVMPSLSFGIAPISIFNSSIPLLQNITIGASADLTQFRQNHYHETSYIRNARRFNTVPYVQWSLGSLGPVRFKTNLKFDYQEYFFPFEKGENTFSKYAFINESEASFEVSRVFGLARRETRPLPKIDNKKEKDTDVIGSIPSFKNLYAKDEMSIIHNSYKHSQVFKVKHYMISGERHRGNEDFKNQISSENGLFDLHDPIRGTEHLSFTHSSFKTGLPLNNTIELQWRNTLIKKTPRPFDVYQNDKYLRDNFSYSPISYLNVSQGYNFYEADKRTFTDSLTRLFVEFGFSWENFAIALTEYYFYQTRGNILNVNLDKYFDFARLGMDMVYDSFSTPYNKRVTFHGAIRPLDMIEFSANYTYDIETQKNIRSNYNLLYSPLSKCWQIGLTRTQSELKNKPDYGFYFEVNFDGQTTRSLIRRAR